MLPFFLRIYGFEAVIYHLTNIVGPRSRHEIIYGFVQKLREEPRRLEILGDGTQTKILSPHRRLLMGLERVALVSRRDGRCLASLMLSSRFP